MIRNAAVSKGKQLRPTVAKICGKYLCNSLVHNEFVACNFCYKWPGRNMSCEIL